jgi:hypothetical protein
MTFHLSDGLDLMEGVAFQGDSRGDYQVTNMASPSRRAPFREFALPVGIDLSGVLKVA